MNKVLLAPSILSADFGRLSADVQHAEEGGADWIHVDVMDGHFVPNITIGPGVTAAVRKATDLPVDVHLMIENPERYIDAFAQAGADRISVHYEACPHLHRVLNQIREAGARPGVALNPATPVAAVRDILSELDLIVIMSVNPGFGGQRFIPHTVERVREARAMIQEAEDSSPSTSGSPAAESIRIEVDGGIDRTTAGSVVGAGADVLVAGSAVYGHPNGVVSALAELRTATRRTE